MIIMRMLSAETIAELITREAETYRDPPPERTDGNLGDDTNVVRLPCGAARPRHV